MLEVENIKKRFFKKEVLKGVSFKLEKPGIFTILGPNGSGKTTTLRIITGVMLPDEGSITLDGACGFELKKITGYIPDSPELPQYLTGYEFLKLTARIYRCEDTNRMHEFIKKFEIVDAINNLISSYSFGMKQKLLFTSVFMRYKTNLKLLVIDEPVIGMDPASIEMLVKILNEIKNEVYIIISTHLIDFATRISDRIGFIKDGRIIESKDHDVKAEYFRIFSEDTP